MSNIIKEFEEAVAEFREAARKYIENEGYNKVQTTNNETGK